MTELLAEASAFGIRNNLIAIAEPLSEKFRPEFKERVYECVFDLLASQLSDDLTNDKKNIVIFDSNHIENKIKLLANKLNKIFSPESQVAIVIDQVDISYAFATELIKHLKFDPVPYFNMLNFEDQYRAYDKVILLTYSFDIYTTWEVSMQNLTSGFNPDSIIVASLISKRAKAGDIRKFTAIEYNFKDNPISGYGLPNALGLDLTSRDIKILLNKPKKE